MNDETISFAMEVKEEAASIERSSMAMKALLSGFVKGNGSLRIGSKEELELSTESSSIAKMLYSQFNKLFDAHCRFAYTRGMGLRKKTRYHVLVENPEPILDSLGIDLWSPLVPEWIKSEETRSAYVAGAFLCSGSVNSPTSSNYHLEITSEDSAYAKKLCHLINRITDRHFNAKITSRRKASVVYMKRGDEISDFLIAIGAPQCCLKFEDVRLSRDFSNIGNRLNNLDCANMSKTNKTAERQIKEIEYFHKHGETFSSNPKLSALLNLRLENPDASLEELASLLSEELASTVTKSNVNHLFRSLHARYEEENHEK